MSAHTEAGRAAEKLAYDELRAKDYATFRECVNAADAIAISHGLDVKVAADIESALVALAARLLP